MRIVDLKDVEQAIEAANLSAPLQQTLLATFRCISREGDDVGRVGIQAISDHLIRASQAAQETDITAGVDEMVDLVKRLTATRHDVQKVVMRKIDAAAGDVHRMREALRG